MPQSWNNSYPIESTLIHNKLSDDTLFSPQKRFLIFDHTANQMELFFSPSFSPQDQFFKGLFGETAAGVSPEFSTNPMIEEKWDENHLTDGEGENDMLEDTEEIDTLFYSDSDDDDEVASMGHTPFMVGEGYGKEELLEEPIEQSVCSDDSQKMQKLLHGKFKKSPWAIHENPCGDEIDEVKREKKVKIRRALKILESIVPGLDGRDPLSVIDKAIVYLKLMKTEAEAQRLS